MTQLHFIPVDLGSPVLQCAVADPYVIIMTAEGVVTMFVLKTDSYMGKTHRLALQKPQLHTVRVLDISAARARAPALYSCKLSMLPVQPLPYK